MPYRRLPGRARADADGRSPDAAGGRARGAGRLDGRHLRAEQRGRAIRLLLGARTQQGIAQFLAPRLAHVETAYPSLARDQPAGHHVRLRLHIISSPAARGCSRRFRSISPSWCSRQAPFPFHPQAMVRLISSFFAISVRGHVAGTASRVRHRSALCSVSGLPPCRRCSGIDCDGGRTIRRLRWHNHFRRNRCRRVSSHDCEPPLGFRGQCGMLNCSALCNGQADGIDRPTAAGAADRPGAHASKFDECLRMDVGECLHLPLAQCFHEADRGFGRDVRRNVDPTSAARTDGDNAGTRV